MSDSYHFSTGLLELLNDTIPTLIRSKEGVIRFFRSAGVDEADLAPMVKRLREDPSVKKFHIAQHVLQAVNERQDPGLAPRREIIKRIVEFEEFSTCWPEDVYKAKGLVAEVRRVVKTHDAFTKMHMAHDAAQREAADRRTAEVQALANKRAEIIAIRDRFAALFMMEDDPHGRGRELESVLNDLFRAFGILITENFKRKPPDSSLVLEQIDGVISLDGTLHLVEMKWLKGPVGVAEFAQHVVRLFQRPPTVQGIFIASSAYTQPVLSDCAGFLNTRVMVLATLQELFLLLDRQGDLLEFLRKKIQAAVLEKQPFVQILG